MTQKIIIKKLRRKKAKKNKKIKINFNLLCVNLLKNVGKIELKNQLFKN